MDLDMLIDGALSNRASDIHIIEDARPYFRVDEELLQVEHLEVTHEEMISLLEEIVPGRLKSRLDEARSVDFAHSFGDRVRCRMTAFYERHRLAIVLRLIPLTPPTYAELALPEILSTFSKYHRGVVLATGPTGCGKSSTLAAMVDDINSNRRCSIITIEDPIEYLHENKKAVVSQREVGDDVEDFTHGLIQSMRQDPDVILVGEMRDYETMRTGIQAGETGHLVLSTLHTSSAVQTIERFRTIYPENEQDLLREQLASNLKAVITQELIRKAGGKGRAPAIEILIFTDLVVKLVLEDRIDDIYELMKGGHGGMQTLDRSLADLVRAQTITLEEGEKFSRNPQVYHRYVTGKLASSDVGHVLS